VLPLFIRKTVYNLKISRPLAYIHSYVSRNNVLTKQRICIKLDMNFMSTNIAGIKIRM
jgi:hypothetical protein